MLLDSADEQRRGHRGQKIKPFCLRDYAFLWILFLWNTVKHQTKVGFKFKLLCRESPVCTHIKGNLRDKTPAWLEWKPGLKGDRKKMRLNKPNYSLQTETHFFKHWKKAYHTKLTFLIYKRDHFSLCHFKSL